MDRKLELEARMRSVRNWIEDRPAGQELISYLIRPDACTDVAGARVALDDWLRKSEVAARRQGRELPIYHFERVDRAHAELEALLDNLGLVLDPALLLYVVPTRECSVAPVLDKWTRRMTASFHAAESCAWFSCGVHECVCGAISTPSDYALPNGWITNALCVHYLAYHRDEVPEPELERVGRLGEGEAEPNQRELQEGVTQKPES
jgi:hypothetical protein